MLVFVVTQDDVIDSLVSTPLLFEEMDTLDLSGLVIGDDGAAAVAKVLQQNPALRRCVLADNKIGESGGAALSEALAVNTTLQVS
jgi:Ran GTPase-activating protein (RanGAP) involved in mRNA processing and transport